MLSRKTSGIFRSYSALTARFKVKKKSIFYRHTIAGQYAGRRIRSCINALIKNQSCIEWFFVVFFSEMRGKEQTILLKIRNVYLTSCIFRDIFDVWNVFFSLQKSFLENGMDVKFWKKFQISIESLFLQFALPGVTKSPVWIHF